MWKKGSNYGILALLEKFLGSVLEHEQTTIINPAGIMYGVDPATDDGVGGG